MQPRKLLNNPLQYRLSKFFASLVVTILFSVSLIAKASDLPDFSTLAEKTSPAIVNISTLSKPKSNKFIHPFNLYGDELPDILRRYFGIQIQVPENDNDSQFYRPKPQSLGSGFVISQDGYILTNNHVIENADEIIVRFSDRGEYTAKLIGSDKQSDLALLKVDAKNLIPVKTGHSKNLKPGQWVFAIGSPFGFEYSVTKGIVSALNRSLPTDNYVPFIQTDVPINPGNSGGPLLNMDGEVIGINSQIFTRSGGFMGLSFAIPIDDAMNVADQLKNKGHVSRGWLGVIVQEVDRNLAESFGLDRTHGALLTQVVPSGPADKGGLEAGDIITRFNSYDIKFSSDLPVAVGRSPVGEKVTVELTRAGKQKTLKLKVGELPDNPQNMMGGNNKSQKENRLGVQVDNLTDDYKQRLGVEKGTEGVVIIQVNSGIGYVAGLKNGDIIAQINHQDIKNSNEFYKIISSLPTNRTISMLVIRRGLPGYITFKLSE